MPRSLLPEESVWVASFPAASLGEGSNMLFLSILHWRHSNPSLLGANTNGMSGARLISALLAVHVLSCLPVHGAISPDAGFSQRQEDVLERLGGLYSWGRSYSDSQMVTFGQQAMYLASRLENDRRGFANGTSPGEADAEILRMAVIAHEKLNPPGQGPWTWAQSGSPAIKHAALAFGLIMHQWGDRLSPETRAAIVLLFSDSDWETRTTFRVVNGTLSVVAGRLLVGEALGYDNSIWTQGIAELRRLYENNMTHGGV